MLRASADWRTHNHERLQTSLFLISTAFPIPFIILLKPGVVPPASRESEDRDGSVCELGKEGGGRRRPTPPSMPSRASGLLLRLPARHFASTLSTSDEFTLLTSSPPPRKRRVTSALVEGRGATGRTDNAAPRRREARSHAVPDLEHRGTSASCKKLIFTTTQISERRFDNSILMDEDDKRRVKDGRQVARWRQVLQLTHPWLDTFVWEAVRASEKTRRLPPW